MTWQFTLLAVPPALATFIGCALLLYLQRRNGPLDRALMILITAGLFWSAGYTAELLGDDLQPIQADSTQLQQVVMNLVINASEAIGSQDGKITIVSGEVVCNRSFLQRARGATNLKEGIYIYVEVTDTGSGMAKESMERLFEPFYTTKFTGRGLGMAVVYGIVRAHFGNLEGTLPFKVSRHLRRKGLPTFKFDFIKY